MPQASAIRSCDQSRFFRNWRTRAPKALLRSLPTSAVSGNDIQITRDFEYYSEYHFPDESGCYFQRRMLREDASRVAVCSVGRFVVWMRRGIDVRLQAGYSTKHTSACGTGHEWELGDSG